MLELEKVGKIQQRAKSLIIYISRQSSIRSFLFPRKTTSTRTHTHTHTSTALPLLLLKQNSAFIHAFGIKEWQEKTGGQELREKQTRFIKFCLHHNLKWSKTQLHNFLFFLLPLRWSNRTQFAEGWTKYIWNLAMTTCSNAISFYQSFRTIHVTVLIGFAQWPSTHDLLTWTEFNELYSLTSSLLPASLFLPFFNTNFSSALRNISFHWYQSNSAQTPRITHLFDLVLSVHQLPHVYTLLN